MTTTLRNADELISDVNDSIEEAAADTGMDEDEIWFDVAVSMIQVADATAATKREVARRLGIPASAIR